jgi:hypothetical protein
MARRTKSPTTRRTRILLAALAAWLVVPPALVGVVVRRRTRFQTIAFRHLNQIRGPIPPTALIPYDQTLDQTPLPSGGVRKNDWHIKLYVKYAEATTCSWLPVSPDPPEPD